MSRLKRLIREIHRRGLWQVLSVYLISSWIALKVTDTATAALGLPDWVPQAALVLLIVLLPVGLATAFVQEGVGGGAARAEPAPHEGEAEGEPTPEIPAPKPRGAHHRVSAWRNATAATVAMLALLAGLACKRAPEITPEDATQRFVTSASPREALEAAKQILEAMEFEIVMSGEGLACGERRERISGTGTPPYHVPYSYFNWVRLDLAAEKSASGTLVTIVPRRMHKSSDGTRQLGLLTKGDVELCEKAAAKLKQALGQR